MESVLQEHQKLENSANLGKTIQDVEHIIGDLKEARAVVERDAKATSMVLGKVRTPLKNSFDKINDDFVDIHKALAKYSKAMEKKTKDSKFTPFGDLDALSTQPSLINRAIAMHLLREGHFDVASTFITETNAREPLKSVDATTTPIPNISAPAPATTLDKDSDTPMPNFTSSNVPRPATIPPVPPPSGITFNPRDTDTPAPWADSPSSSLSLEDALRAHQPSFSTTPDSASNIVPTPNSPLTHAPESLKHQFAEMYHILHELRTNQNLGPAIAWTRAHSAVLDARGSNLEFDLCRLQYVSLFSQPLSATTGPLAATTYARETFPRFFTRYAPQVRELLGALAYTPNIVSSPYRVLFSENTFDPATLSAAATAFTSDFCSLLSLSSASPLLTAVTAGCIALPTLQKFSQIQQAHRTSWTTAAELPVEVPLPPAFAFHSIFVCPVSKEQTTDANPPMMMPCGHVLAKGSLEQLGRGGGRFKCPYCPGESSAGDALRVYL